jgi:hydrogenase maturation protease
MFDASSGCGVEIAIDNTKNTISLRVIGAGPPHLYYLGLRVIDEILDRNISGVKAMKGFSIGVDLLFQVGKYEKILVVDAMRAGLEPGDFRLLSEEDITNNNLKWFSVHDISLPDAIALKKNLGIKAKIFILGIQVKSVEVGEKISDELLTRIPDYIDLIAGFDF